MHRERQYIEKSSIKESSIMDINSITMLKYKKQPWVQHMPNVIQRGIIDLISIGQAVNLFTLKIDEDMMPCFNAVCISMRLSSSSLIIFAAD